MGFTEAEEAKIWSTLSDNRRDIGRMRDRIMGNGDPRGSIVGRLNQAEDDIKAIKEGIAIMERSVLTVDVYRQIEGEKAEVEKAAAAERTAADERRAKTYERKQNARLAILGLVLSAILAAKDFIFAGIK